MVVGGAAVTASFQRFSPVRSAYESVDRLFHRGEMLTRITPSVTTLPVPSVLVLRPAK